MLRPQDILILIKLVALNDAHWTNSSLARSLGISPAEVGQALKRASNARLYDARRQVPRISALEEFLVHGLKYVWAPVRGPLTRGMPTAFAAPPLKDAIIQPPTEWPPVWPSPTGLERGYELKPLYDTVVDAASRDSALYQLLALVDAIREGRPREQKIAIDELKQRLHNYDPAHLTCRLQNDSQTGKHPTDQTGR
jgi:hypothetical protein